MATETQFEESNKITDHCRFCAQEKKTEKLLYLSGNQESQQYLKLIEFFKMDFVNIYDSKLPKTLCDNCCEEFRSCYLFFTKVKESQIKLNKVYKKQLNDFNLNKDIKEEPTDLDYLKTESLSDDDKQIGTELNVETPHLFQNRIKKTYKRSRKVTPKNTPKIIKRTVKKDKDFANDCVHSDKNTIEQASNLRAKDENNLSDTKTGEEKIFIVPIIKLLNHNDEVSTDSDTTDSRSVTSSDKNHSDIISDPESCQEAAETLLIKTESLNHADNNISSNEYGDNISVDPYESKKIDESWSDYPWSCRHCSTVFKSMEEVRCHSKELHRQCYGFNCVDCEHKFNTFNSFVEHVRRHRDELRYYCQYCNKKFDHPAQCVEHALTHWANGQKICERCGEICPDADSLDRHRKLYKKANLPEKDRRRKPRLVNRDCGLTVYGGVSVFQSSLSWSQYEWTCEDCWVRFPDVYSLRSHTQEFHNKCFAMKCVDCLQVIANYTAFVKHVTAHRPYLEKYCQYCDQHFEDSSELQTHVSDHLKSNWQPCDGCGQTFDNNTQLLQHLERFKPERTKGRITKEELTCNICQKMFKYLCSLRAHVSRHETNRQRDHVCDQCGKSFLNSCYLASHVKTHDNIKQEICLICNKTFATKRTLKAHILLHRDTKDYTCDICGKQFKNKHRMRGHIINHSDVKPFQCTICSKRFKLKLALKNHISVVHNGVKMYSCECCDKTFSNWGNCNKHMMRIHGVTLAKTKITPLGRADINRKTGQVRNLNVDKNAKDWIEQILKPEKGKKTAK